MNHKSVRRRNAHVAGSKITIDNVDLQFAFQKERAASQELAGEDEI